MIIEFKGKLTKRAAAATDGRFDVCVLCHKVTDVPVAQPIQARKFYIKDSGQLCEDCYRKIYSETEY